MRRQQLQALSREELISEAERAGVPRPRVLTQAELVDEILKRTAGSERDKTRARGWLGRARDLIATVVEKGLHLPDAAAAIRSGPKGWPPPPPPLPTVTLAEIYAAQGHLERAVAVLDEVLRREPDHQEARELRERFLAQLARGPKSAPEPPVSAAADTEPSPAQAMATETKPESEPEEEAAPEPVPAASDEGAPPRVTLPSARPPAGLEALRAEAAESEAPKAKEETAAPEAAAAPEEETAAPEVEVVLPERYEVDEVVALAVDPSTFYVYWEVRPTTFAHMAARAPNGSLALRVTAVTPGWDGPIVETRDVAIDALHGDQFIHHVRPRADVRVSVGWIAEGRFDPIAIGAEVSAPRAFVAAGAPGPAGAPQDLSEGPHGAPVGFVRPVTFAEHPRAAALLAAGWVPREIPGAAMEGAPGQSPEGGAGPTGWIWVPGPISEQIGMSVMLGPSTAEAPRAEPSGRGATGSWGGASESGPWGGASESGPWGGASER